MTEVVKISNKGAIAKAVAILSSGGIVVYPTETCYGIGADATSDDAVKKVIRIKKRDKGKKISIAFSDLKMAKRYVVMTKRAEKLAKAFMPGPLTLIVESKGKKKVGFRVPDNNLVRRIIKKLGKPITTTSANISGKGELYKIRDVVKAFSGKADLILDAGNLPRKKPSTVFDTTNMKILRMGPISEKDIKSILA
jgi:L-threonylcarbamoyladenylate synthase